MRSLFRWSLGSDSHTSYRAGYVQSQRPGFQRSLPGIFCFQRLGFGLSKGIKGTGLACFSELEISLTYVFSRKEIAKIA